MTVTMATMLHWCMPVKICFVHNKVQRADRIPFFFFFFWPAICHLLRTGLRPAFGSQPTSWESMLWITCNIMVLYTVCLIYLQRSGESNRLQYENIAKLVVISSSTVCPGPTGCLSSSDRTGATERNQTISTCTVCGCIFQQRQHLHKDDVPSFGVGRDGTGNCCKAIWVDDGLFSFHEFGQTTLQLQVNICGTETGGLLTVCLYWVRLQRAQRLPERQSYIWCDEGIRKCSASPSCQCIRRLI